MLPCAEELKIIDIKESLFRIMRRSCKGGFNKPFKNKNTCNDERLDIKKMPRPTKTSNLISTFYSLWP